MNWLALNEMLNFSHGRVKVEFDGFLVGQIGGFKEFKLLDWGHVAGLKNGIVKLFMAAKNSPCQLTNMGVFCPGPIKFQV